MKKDFEKIKNIKILSILSIVFFVIFIFSIIGLIITITNIENASGDEITNKIILFNVLLTLSFFLDFVFSIIASILILAGKFELDKLKDSKITFGILTLVFSLFLCAGGFFSLVFSNKLKETSND